MPAQIAFLTYCDGDNIRFRNIQKPKMQLTSIPPPNHCHTHLPLHRFHGLHHLLHRVLSPNNLKVVPSTLNNTKAVQPSPPPSSSPPQFWPPAGSPPQLTLHVPHHAVPNQLSWALFTAFSCWTLFVHPTFLPQHLGLLSSPRTSHNTHRPPPPPEHTTGILIHSHSSLGLEDHKK